MVGQAVVRALAGAVVACLLGAGSGVARADVLFTYQGRITGATGAIDLRATLYNAVTGGSTQSSTATASGIVPDASGVFSTPLNFTTADVTGDRWLQLEVATAGSGTFIALTPRQPVTAAPRATFAQSVPWTGVTGVPASVTSPFAPWSATFGGINYIGGNVGIGADMPQRLLQIGDFGAPSEGMARFVSVSQDLQGYRAWDIGVARANLPQPGASFNFVISDATAQPYDPLLNPMFTIEWNTGNVGIGTPDPTSKLTVNGTASKPGGGSWAVFSDPCMKHDIAPMRGTLERLLSLHGYSFEYNADAVADGRCLPGRQIGLMADEVERVFPDWVSRDDKGVRMVTERATTALMVEALRELREQACGASDRATRRVEELAKENAALRAEVERVAAMVRTLAEAKGVRP